MPKAAASPELFYRTTFRVLVLRNADPEAGNGRVLAIAIDLNLAGRGRELPEALEDLRETIWASLKDEWEEVIPSYQPDPDPEYLKAFRDPSVAAIDGDHVLARLALQLEVFITPAKPSANQRPEMKPRMVYEEACAVG